MTAAPNEPGAPLDLRTAVLLIIAFGIASAMLLNLYVKTSDTPAIYLPSGILWAGLMLLTRRGAILLAVGAFLAQLLGEFLVYQSPASIAFSYSIAKITEGIVGVLLVRKAIGEPVLQPRLEHVLKFVFIACIAVPLLFAIPPTLARMAFLESAMNQYFQWAILQGAGTAIAAPLLIFWLTRSSLRISRRKLEVFALATITTVVYAFVFIIGPKFVAFNTMLYLTFPALIWASMRFGCRGASTSNFLLTVVAVGAALYFGFPGSPLPQPGLSVVEIQLFILITATISLLLGAYAEEREDAISLQELNRDRLSALSLRLVENEENYRLKIATLLHDDVGQMLAVSKIRLKLAERALTDAPEMKNELALVAEAIDEAIETTRRMTRETVSTLYPVGNLEDAVRANLENISDGLPIGFNLQSEDLPLIDKSLTAVLSRCTRECIVNALKHASARHIDVRMSYRNELLGIHIADDGAGFDIDTVDLKDPGSTSFGLVSVKNAVDALGGTFNIQSDADGTRIAIEVPVLGQTTA